MSQGTRDALIRAAERMLRFKGYAAFSYADLSEVVGIRKASIHHHFPTKEDLGLAIVKAYIENLVQNLERIEAEYDSVFDRLNEYSKSFRSNHAECVLPLCGALAAEMAALPASLQVLTREFFEMQLNWLTKILNQAVKTKHIPKTSNTRKKAYQILSILEGASFVDWAMRDGEALDFSAIKLIAEAA